MTFLLQLLDFSTVLVTSARMMKDVFCFETIVSFEQNLNFTIIAIIQNSYLNDLLTRGGILQKNYASALKWVSFL